MSVLPGRDGQERARSSRISMRYVRNILRFLFWSGRIPQDLSAAVPVAAGGRPDGLPRHLEAGVVRKLLEAVRGDRPCDLRDHAMLLLMACLGLRAQEVVAARLDDIDWGAGRMLVRGKGGQFDRVPIPVGRRRGHRRLGARRAQRGLAPRVRVRTAAVRTAHIVRGHPRCASQCLPAGRPGSARWPSADPCVAARPRHGTAGPGILARRDRRCAPPPLRAVDNGVCKVRPRGAASARPPLARGRSTSTNPEPGARNCVIHTRPEREGQNSCG